MSQMPRCTRVDAIVSAVGTPDPGSASVAMTVPTAKRVSGSSVCSWTVTSPRRPWGLPMRARTTFMSRILSGLASVGDRCAKDGRGDARGAPRSSGTPLSGDSRGSRQRSAHAVGVDDVDAHVVVAREGADDGAQRARRAAGAADDAAEVVGVDPDLEQLTAAQLLADHDDVLVVVDDALDEVLERLLEHAQASAFAASSPAASAGASVASSALGSSALGSSALASALGSAFLAAFLRGVGPSVPASVLPPAAAIAAS